MATLIASKMADVVEAFGLEKVRALGLKVSGVELVGASKHEKYG